MYSKKETEYKGIHFLRNKELNYLELIMDNLVETYSTVTDLARFRGWSTLQFLMTAM